MEGSAVEVERRRCAQRLVRTFLDLGDEGEVGRVTDDGTRVR
ncbi:hypothetical protein AB0I22_17230 [Streptomyces sp. NPDC050610]